MCNWVHLYLISDSVRQDSTPSNNQHGRKACLHPEPPELVWWEEGWREGHLQAYQTHPVVQKVSILMVIWLLTSSSFLLLLYTVDTGVKRSQRKHLGNAVILPQLCLHKEKLPEASSPFSVRLLQHFVFLFGNKWNWKVSRRFATITQYFSLPSHPQPAKQQSLIFPPEPLDVSQKVILSLKLPLHSKLENHLASLL